MEWILDQWTQCMLCNVTVLEVAFGMNMNAYSETEAGISHAHIWFGPKLFGDSADTLSDAFILPSGLSSSIKKIH